MDIPQKAEEQTPFSQATLKLAKKDLALVSGEEVKVGSRVRLVITGTVRGMEQGRIDESGEAPDVGSLDVDITNIEVGSDNGIADLFADEING